ncbi:MAG: hypothetical protein ACREBJ_02725 [Nitrosotalea sp.]
MISHRGNIDTILPERENAPVYIDEAIFQGYYVEIDVRLIGDKLFLGHDNPDYEITLQWLLDRKDNLWVHTKNFDALSYLIDQDLRAFYHQKENHTIINSCNLIWSHDLSEANEKSIIPLLSKQDITSYNGAKVFGICSDFVALLRNK